MATNRSNGKTSKPHLTVKGVNPDDPKLKPKWDSYDRYEDFIDSLSIDQKWKGRLKDILRLVVVAGKRMIEIGKKVIELILKVLKKYPRTAAASIVGMTLALIVSHIPVLGLLLAPIMVAMTTVVAFVVFMNEALNRHVLDAFSPMKNATVA